MFDEVLIDLREPEQEPDPNCKSCHGIGVVDMYITEYDIVDSEPCGCVYKDTISGKRNAERLKATSD